MKLLEAERPPIVLPSRAPVDRHIMVHSIVGAKSEHVQPLLRGRDCGWRADEISVADRLPCGAPSMDRIPGSVHHLVVAGAQSEYVKIVGAPRHHSRPAGELSAEVVPHGVGRMP